VAIVAKPTPATILVVISLIISPACGPTIVAPSILSVPSLTSTLTNPPSLSTIALSTSEKLRVYTLYFTPALIKSVSCAPTLATSGSR